MPSILSSFLVILKLAMAVNDGLHTMLSNLYSVVETTAAANYTHNNKTDKEMDTAMTLKRSKSRILEEFNKRREQLVPQPDEMIPNFARNNDPSPKTTTTTISKAVLLKESTDDSAKNFLSRQSKISSEEDVYTEVSSLYSESSYFCATSSVSSEDIDAHNYQSSYGIDFEQLFLAYQDSRTKKLCDLLNLIQGTKQIFEKSLSHEPINPDNTDNNLSGKDLNTKVTENTFLKKKLSMLKIMDSLEKYTKEYCEVNKDNFSSWINTRNENLGINSSYSTNESEIENNKFYSCSMSFSSTETASTTSGNESSESSINVSNVINDENSSNQPDIDFTSFGCFRETKPVSKGPPTKCNDNILMPHKKKCIDDVRFLLTCQPNLFSGQIQRSSGDLKDASLEDSSKASSEKPNDSIVTSYQNSECSNTLREETSQPSLPFFKTTSGNLEELEIDSLARIDALKTILMEFGLTDALNKWETGEHDKLSNSNCFKQKVGDEYKCVKRTFNQEFSVEDSNSKKIKFSKNGIFREAETPVVIERIPFSELDTEEKQMEYLNFLTENYKKSEHNFQFENDVFKTLKESAKALLENITNAYNKELHSLSSRTNTCINEFASTGKNSNTNCGSVELEDAGTNDAFSSQQRTSSDLKIDSFGIPVSISSEKDLFANDSFTYTSNYSFANKSTNNNETSTPIKINQDVWVSINLSDSRKEFTDDTEDLYSKDLNVLISEENSKPTHTNHKEIGKEGNALEPKDWVFLASAMSRNYEKAISFLNRIEGSENKDSFTRDPVISMRQEIEYIGIPCKIDCSLRNEKNEEVEIETPDIKFQNTLPISESDGISQRSSSFMSTVVNSGKMSTEKGNENAENTKKIFLSFKDSNSKENDISNVKNTSCEIEDNLVPNQRIKSDDCSLKTDEVHSNKDTDRPVSKIEDLRRKYSADCGGIHDCSASKEPVSN